MKILVFLRFQADLPHILAKFATAQGVHATKVSIFADAKLIFMVWKSIFTDAKLVFVVWTSIFTDAKLIFSAWTSIFTDAKLIFVVWKTIFSAKIIGIAGFGRSVTPAGVRVSCRSLQGSSTPWLPSATPIGVQSSASSRQMSELLSRQTISFSDVNMTPNSTP